MRDIQLDGLRGYACISIVVFHAYHWPMSMWMWSYVDLFFVLSGFLITRIILQGFSTGEFSLRNFMIRRAIRVWPAYYTVLAICLSAVFLNYVLSGEWEFTIGMATAPFFLQYTHHYFDPNLNAGREEFILWFHHSWSLAIEEQFYVLMPLVMVIFKNRLKLALIIFLLLIPTAVVFRANGAFLWSLIARMDALCTGVALAFYFHRFGKKPFVNKRLEGQIALGFTAIGLFLVLHAENFFGMSKLTAEACALLGFNLLYGVLILTLMRGWFTPLNAIFTHRSLVYLGSISYALYLVHVPVRGVILYIAQQEKISACPLWLQALYYLGSIGAAALSKRLIEDPANRLKKHFPTSKQKALLPTGRLKAFLLRRANSNKAGLQN